MVLPEAFTSRHTVALIAFHRHHQSLVDSWTPWLETHGASNPDFSFVELPVISRLWAPLRSLIDGGMTTAIKTPHILERTLTIYGDIRRVTEPLGIATTATITVLAVDGEGAVRWSGTGGYSAAASNQLEAVLATW